MPWSDRGISASAASRYGPGSRAFAARGFLRRCGERRDAQLTVVVPAKAGTHSHRPLLLEEGLSHTALSRDHAVWVPDRASLVRDDEGFLLPHHTRRKSGLAPRRLDVFFQEAVRFLADIAWTGIGPS